MTLLDAQPYDIAKARRRKILITVAVVAVVVLAALAWMYRNWPEEHSVDKFFAKFGDSLPEPIRKEQKALAERLLAVSSR